MYYQLNYQIQALGKGGCTEQHGDVLKGHAMFAETVLEQLHFRTDFVVQTLSHPLPIKHTAKMTRRIIMGPVVVL